MKNTNEITSLILDNMNSSNKNTFIYKLHEENIFDFNILLELIENIKLYTKSLEVNMTFKSNVNNRVVRQPSGFEQLPLKNAISQPKGREIAGLGRQPTGLSNKSNVIKTLMQIWSYSYKSLIWHYDKNDLSKIIFMNGKEEDAVDTIDLMGLHIQNSIEELAGKNGMK